jgi:UDP-galactopyranose mutase
MALGFSSRLAPAAVVYDCMDELSLFRGAPPALVERERELLARADLVFTGGASLYEAKRGRHPAVHLFPSSIDADHFGRARGFAGPEPADQARIPRPRLGYFGVIDERIDLDLLAGLAEARPDWQIVMLGPVVKIDPETLPRRGNVHYLGMKDYGELPAYLAGWDVALSPFARNEATRFISRWCRRRSATWCTPTARWGWSRSPRTPRALPPPPSGAWRGAISRAAGSSGSTSSSPAARGTVPTARWRH